MNRPPYDQVSTHRYFNQHAFDTQILSSALSINALILAQTNQKLLGCRTHIEITNPHATAKLYLARSNGVSTTVYQWVLTAAGGFLKEPCSADNDLWIISDTNAVSAIITEVG